MGQNAGGIKGVTASHEHTPLFEARGISKSFGDVTANKDISLKVDTGEILALLGENGAGKSTFVKMTDGVLRPDSGAFLWNGKQITIKSPAAAKRIGIGMIFQHFSSFEALTVLENLALALPQRSLRAIRRDVAEVSERYGLSVNPKSRVERLSAGEKQRVEIVRALLQQPKLLILDEPTSVLTPQEADGLFTTLDSLAEDGMAMIYISHRLSEIKELCDSATILRHGEVVGSCDPQSTSVSEIAEMMIGKTADPIDRAGAYVGGPRLVVDNLSIPVKEGVPLKNISFSARRGEIMGIAGIAGEGQDTLFAALSGERRTPKAQSIKIDGQPIGTMGPTSRRRKNIAFAPEQRLGHAAIADFSLSENLRLTRHAMREFSNRKLRARSLKIREDYDVRSSANDPKAGTLSGGNLQKFVIGRELDRHPDVFVVAQPTWGVDAGAASSIRNKLLSVAQRGGTVVVISQDLDEIFQIADRVAVLHRGELSQTHLVHDMTPDKIGMLMSGEDIDSEPKSTTTQNFTRNRARKTTETTEETIAVRTGTAHEQTKEPIRQAAPLSVVESPKPATPPVITSSAMTSSVSVPQSPPPAKSASQSSPRRRILVSGTVTTPWTAPEVIQKGTVL